MDHRTGEGSGVALGIGVCAGVGLCGRGNVRKPNTNRECQESKDAANEELMPTAKDTEDQEVQVHLATPLTKEELCYVLSDHHCEKTVVKYGGLPQWIHTSHTKGLQMKK
ncbi:hypothetical protein NDU88_003569 [Pleurodeles waltl]|uniref:Uncharacterized protein n=1 Tax=Pleurodeles waltl TaxID=8319 RepID=A0AAV7RFF6_PLEWA|nr:hypothetical protein NDU88_003569 [Pleurodeles waltl]